jgi:hypothetical protein
MTDGDPQIIQADALAWLAQNPAAAHSSVITSLPDVSELPLSFEAWREWFITAARAVIRWLPDDGVAIFFQSDIRRAGTHVDKGYLVMRAVEAESAALLWHKIACRLPPDTASFGRASYAHMLGVARAPRPPARSALPDVLADAGDKSWTRGMGRRACELACRYLRDETATRVVVDPFCGRGSALAAAQSFGFQVLGVDLSAKRCRAARAALSGVRPEPQPPGLRPASAPHLPAAPCPAPHPGSPPPVRPPRDSG